MNYFLRTFVVTALPCVAAMSFGQRLLSLEQGGAIREVNMATGATTLLSSFAPQFAVSSATYNPLTGHALLVAANLQGKGLYHFNLDTFAVSLIGFYPSTLQFSAIEFDSSTNTLFGISPGLNGGSTGTGLYRLDMTTGVHTLVGFNSTFLGGEYALAYDAAGDVMYASSTATDKLYSVNRSNGMMTLIGGFTNPRFMTDAAFDSGDGSIFMVDSVVDNLYRVNKATGTETLIGYMGAPTQNSTALIYVPGAAAPVPEPATLAALGLGAAAVLRRRRRSSNSKK